MSNLIETRQVKDITELLKYVIFSNYVFVDYDNKEFPLSIIIVAPPGTGKTAMVDQYADNDGILTFSKITEWALLKNHLDELKSGKIKRLLIPDMVNQSSMKIETVNSLVTFLNSYISWEGVRTISTYAGHYPIALRSPLRGSLMATMAVGDFERIYKTLAASGFLSRLLIVGYFYSRDTVKQIMVDIAHKKHSWVNLKLELPKERQFIGIDSSLVEKLIPYALELGRKVAGYDIRALQQMTLLSKSKALSEGRLVVNADDIDKTLYIFKTYVLKIACFDTAIKEAIIKDKRD